MCPNALIIQSSFSREIRFKTNVAQHFFTWNSTSFRPTMKRFLLLCVKQFYIRCVIEQLFRVCKFRESPCILQKQVARSFRIFLYTKTMTIRSLHTNHQQNSTEPNTIAYLHAGRSGSDYLKSSRENGQTKNLCPRSALTTKPIGHSRLQLSRLLFDGMRPSFPVFATRLSRKSLGPAR